MRVHGQTIPGGGNMREITENTIRELCRGNYNTSGKLPKYNGTIPCIVEPQVMVTAMLADIQIQWAFTIADPFIYTPPPDGNYKPEPCVCFGRKQIITSYSRPHNCVMPDLDAIAFHRPVTSKRSLISYGVTNVSTINDIQQGSQRDWYPPTRIPGIISVRRMLTTWDDADFGSVISNNMTSHKMPSRFSAGCSYFGRLKYYSAFSVIYILPLGILFPQAIAAREPDYHAGQLLPEYPNDQSQYSWVNYMRGGWWDESTDGVCYHYYYEPSTTTKMEWKVGAETVAHFDLPNPFSSDINSNTLYYALARSSPLTLETRYSATQLEPPVTLVMDPEYVGANTITSIVTTTYNL